MLSGSPIDLQLDISLPFKLHRALSLTIPPNFQCRKKNTVTAVSRDSPSEKCSCWLNDRNYASFS